MDEAVTLSFEVRGGSPTVLEVTHPDGSKSTIRVAVTVMEVLAHPGLENPVNPGKPVYQVRANLSIAD